MDRIGYFLIVVACLLANASDGTRADPLQQLTKHFPDTVATKNKGRLLEFCPDGTCDGFVGSDRVPLVTLKEFAYLYEYFFSDYIYLEDWRKEDGVAKAAEQILTQPQYSKCKHDDSLDKARCVLQELSRDGRIRLIFIRYDEGERNVVREDLSQQLFGQGPAQQTSDKPLRKVTGLPRYMTDLPQPIPDQIKLPDAPKTVRRVQCFKAFTHESTMADVVRKCGIPDEHQGSGIYIFLYDIDDGSLVVVGTGDLQALMYVNHVQGNGVAQSLLPRVPAKQNAPR